MVQSTIIRERVSNSNVFANVWVCVCVYKISYVIRTCVGTHLCGFAQILRAI